MRFDLSQWHRALPNTARRRAPRALAAILAVGTGLAAAPAWAADGCSGDGRVPDVSTSFNSGNVVIDRSKNQAEINRLGVTGKTITSGNWRRVGLTRASFKMNTRAGMRMQGRAGSESLCVTVERLEIDLGLPELTIFIPQVYDRQSCAYREILAHEHDHVAAHRRTLARFRDTFEDAGRNAVATLSPFRAPSKQAAQSRVNQVVSQALQPVVAQFQQAQRAANAALDTESEYRRIQRRCNDW